MAVKEHTITLNISAGEDKNLSMKILTNHWIFAKWPVAGDLLLGDRQGILACPLRVTAILQKLSNQLYRMAGLTALVAYCCASPMGWAKEAEVSKTSPVKSPSGPRVVEIPNDSGVNTTATVSQSPEPNGVSSEASRDQILDSPSEPSTENALDSSGSAAISLQSPDQEELERQQRAESFRRLAEALRRLAESQDQAPPEKSQ